MKNTSRFKTIGTRVKQLRKAAGLTQTDLSSRLGMTRAAISALETGKNGTRETTLRAIAEILDVDYARILDTDLPLEDIATSDTGLESFLDSLSARSIRQYKRVPLGARATFASSYAQDYDFHHLEDFPVVAMPGDPDKGLVMDIDGDSMDPQLRHGMCVLVEEVPPVDGWKMARPGVYVVVYRDHFVVKRIKENTLANTGKVWLSSDNPDGGREEVIMDDIRGMWRVHRIVHAPVR